MGRCLGYETTMEITDFEGLLLAARLQPRPQRMLFLFVKTVVQKDYTAEQRAAFAAGAGGALQPLFCVDLSPDDVRDFAALSSEADQQGTEWDKVMIACIDAPTSVGAKKQIDQALRSMVARVESGGELDGFLCFDRDGAPVLFE